MTGSLDAAKCLLKNLDFRKNHDGDKLLAACRKRFSECRSPCRIDADGQCGLWWNHGRCCARIERKSDKTVPLRATDSDVYDQEARFDTKRILRHGEKLLHNPAGGISPSKG